MPTDMSQIEDRLRAAYSDVAATVRPEDISEHPPAATSPVHWRTAARTGRRRGPALAAAAAVLLIVITATVIPQVLQSGSRHGSERPGPAAHVGHSHMAYVATQRDQLIPVDLATGTTLTPIPLGVKGAEVGIATSPDGKMAYVLSARGQLVPVDVRRGKAGQPINFGGVSRGIVTTPDGKAAYVLQPPYGVVAVDLATRTALGFIKVHDAADFALTPNGKTLYVLSSSFREKAGLSLTAIDTTTNTTIATIELPAKYLFPVLAMAPDGKTVYVAFGLNDHGNFRSPASIRSTDEIIPVDVASNTEQKPIVSGTVSGIMHDLTISPDGQTGYLQQTQSVIPVDLRSGAVLTPIPLPDVSGFIYEITLSPDGQRLYLIPGTGLKVIPIDTATGRAMQPIQLSAPRGYASWQGGLFAPGSTKTLYVLSGASFPRTIPGYGPGMLTPVDVATGAVGKSIDFPTGLDVIVFSP